MHTQLQNINIVPNLEIKVEREVEYGVSLQWEQRSTWKIPKKEDEEEKTAWKKNKKNIINKTRNEILDDNL